MTAENLVVSAPGRICLFGEHQDYLGLAVIAAAIDRRITISGKRRDDRVASFDLPDTGEVDVFTLCEDVPYVRSRDYLRSAVNVLRRSGAVSPRGWDLHVRGSIPINAGTSSSSALVVAWVRFLLEAAGDARAGDPATVAELAYLSEVAEFGEPGGRMDHYASALGGVLRMRFVEPMTIAPLPTPPGEFVLGNSLEKKDTTGMLARIKSGVRRGETEAGGRIPGFSLRSALTDDLEAVISRLDPDAARLLKSALLNRDLTEEGARLFSEGTFDDVRFGALLSRQQKILRDGLGISTPRIDKMIDAALTSGALGAKINGSGGGGCMFAYAPGQAEVVAEAVRRTGAEAAVVRIDEGVRREPPASRIMQEDA